MKRIPTSFTIILTLAVIFPVSAGSQEDWRIPPGRLFDIGGYQLHLLCEGEGEPTVILDAGIGGFSLEWTAVQRLMSAQVRVCAYDRAGYGWSDVGPSPRTTDREVEELRTLLKIAGLTPPFVLTGHSFGGYNMQYYAKVYPWETAGLVLVDSSHPEQIERLPDLPAQRERAQNGNIVTYFNGQSTFKYYPEDVREKLLRVLSLAKNQTTYRRESFNFAISGAQVERAGPLPDIPLIVVTRGKRVWPEDPYGNMLEFTWFEMQEELARLTPTGRQIIATQSDHLIHLEQPDLVASAILTVVDEVRDQLKDQSPVN